MDIYGWIFIGGLALTVLLGAIFGFGKIFKFCTGGIFGKIIGVWLCITFGGMIASIPVVNDLIVKGNNFFGGYAQILEKLNIATWIYYIVLFVVFLILKKIIVAIVKKVFEPKDKKTLVGGIRSIINKALGAVFFGAFWLVLVWVLLAVVELLTDVEPIAVWLQSISVDKASRLIYGLYTSNPIDFLVLLG